MRLDRIIAVRNDKTVYRDGDRCLKVFSNTYSASQVLREAQLLASVSEVGLPVPRLLSVTIWDGKWTIVTEYVHGTAMRQRMVAIMARLVVASGAKVVALVPAIRPCS